MVQSCEKWICGQGMRWLYYCEGCGTPYETLGEALNCEEGHRRERDG